MGAAFPGIQDSSDRETSCSRLQKIPFSSRTALPSRTGPWVLHGQRVPAHTVPGIQFPPMAMNRTGSDLDFSNTWCGQDSVAP